MEKDGEIAWDGRIIAVTHEILAEVRSAPPLYIKGEERATMAILHCTNVAGDQTLTCCSPVAEGFLARGVEIIVELTADLAETCSLLGGSVRKLAR